MPSKFCVFKSAWNFSSATLSFLRSLLTDKRKGCAALLNSAFLFKPFKSTSLNAFATNGPMFFAWREIGVSTSPAMSITSFIIRLILLGSLYIRSASCATLASFAKIGSTLLGFAFACAFVRLNAAVFLNLLNCLTPMPPAKSNAMYMGSNPACFMSLSSSSVNMLSVAAPLAPAVNAYSRVIPCLTFLISFS